MAEATDIEFDLVVEETEVDFGLVAKATEVDLGLEVDGLSEGGELDEVVFDL